MGRSCSARAKACSVSGSESGCRVMSGDIGRLPRKHHGRGLPGRRLRKLERSRENVCRLDCQSVNEGPCPIQTASPKPRAKLPTAISRKNTRTLTSSFPGRARRAQYCAPTLGRPQAPVHSLPAFYPGKSGLQAIARLPPLGPGWNPTPPAGGRFRGRLRLGRSPLGRRTGRERASRARGRAGRGAR
jgi:hypothetical protein